MTAKQLLKLETAKQQNTISLIASENIPSVAVMEQLGGCWSLKYGEGYPAKRYYAGNQCTDILENGAKEKALAIFDAEENYRINVQMNAGSMANMMVYLAILKPGDMVLSLNVANGGHISHMHTTSSWTKFFKYANYDLNPQTLEIDLQDYKNKILENKPKLVIIGCSSYPKKISYKEMIDFAHQNSCLVLCDIAHIAGLIATKNHENPFEAGADFVTTTTHKTLRGPRAALLYFKNEFEKIINSTVFPGTSGGPHFNKIAGIYQMCDEILGLEKYQNCLTGERQERSFAQYITDVLRQTKLLETELLKNLAPFGFKVPSPTETHLLLLELPENLDSLEAQKKLENAGIMTNRNMLPFDKKTPWRPSGLRLGCSSVTSLGYSDLQIVELAKRISHILLSK
jgi:glycine hydroxymethyltransferase